MKRTYVDPEELRKRQLESVRRLQTFLVYRAPDVLLRRECVHLLFRLVGGQNYHPNLRTVLFVIREYVKDCWESWEFRLWMFSQLRVYRRTGLEIAAMLGEADAGDDEEYADEEWPEVVEEVQP